MSTEQNDTNTGTPSPERLGSAGVQKFWTGIDCPKCDRGDGNLWIQDNGDGLIYDGDVGHCEECGGAFTLLVDAYDHMYAYVDED